VAMGGRELSHFRWRWDLEMWKVWDILRGGKSGEVMRVREGE
jgi:hypothetical protein